VNCYATAQSLFQLVAAEAKDDPSPPWSDYVFPKNRPTLLQRIEMTQYWKGTQTGR